MFIMCWKVKFLVKVFIFLGKIEGESLNINMDCGYKKFVIG